MPGPDPGPGIDAPPHGVVLCFSDDSRCRSEKNRRAHPGAYKLQDPFFPPGKHPDPGFQLAPVHLVGQQRPRAPDKPRLLHQSPGHGSPGHALFEGTADSPQVGGSAGRHRRGCLLRRRAWPVPLDRPWLCRQFRALQPVPQDDPGDFRDRHLCGDPSVDPPGHGLPDLPGHPGQGSHVHHGHRHRSHAPGDNPCHGIAPASLHHGRKKGAPCHGGVHAVHGSDHELCAGRFCL